MILDSSALIAVITGEEGAEEFLLAMMQAPVLKISAATLLESNIVVLAKQGEEAVNDLAALLADLQVEILEVNETDAALALDAYRRYGKGRNSAALNYGDCFSYAAAAASGLPLLYKGDDFTRTDIAPAL